MTTMKKLFLFLLLSVLALGSFAQFHGRHKIAVFAPLYLDSAFNSAGNYVFNRSFPKFLNPGVEFYQGVQLALDSLQKRNAPLEVFIYDLKSEKRSVAQIMQSREMADVEMIIAHSNATETRLLADIAQAKKIPFISVTLPNDVGVENNPYMVMLNTTLRGHMEGIYKMLQRNYPLDQLIVFRKEGIQEDILENYLKELEKITVSVPLKIKMVDVGTNFSAQTLASHMDSTKRSVIISGSLEEWFGSRLAQKLSELSPAYPITLVGMPTWDNFNFNKPEYKALDIVYTTPYYYNRSTGLERDLAASFEKELNGRPTDMFFRGYETTLRFALLLLDTKKDVASNLTRKGNHVFTRFDIFPVFKDKNQMVLDYFENKNLYFIRVSNGSKRLM